MTGFERILVYAPIEDTELRALEHAAHVLPATGGQIAVVRILEDEAWWAKARAGKRAELRTFIEDWQLEALDARVSRFRERGVDVDVQVRWGTPWLELVRLVLRDGYDLVVKTAEGVARGGGLFFGSTALHLIRKCPCPVWIVTARKALAEQKVLAALDPELDPTRLGLAQRILSLAAALQGAGAEVQIAAAWNAVAESLLRDRMPPEAVAEYVESAQEAARENLAQILAQAPAQIRRAQVRLLRGEARSVLPPLIDREEFDLLILGSLGRVGIAGLLIGDTAESLIRSVHTSVIALKPPGFVCPVPAS